MFVIAGDPFNMNHLCCSLSPQVRVFSLLLFAGGGSSIYGYLFSILLLRKSYLHALFLFICLI